MQKVCGPAEPVEVSPTGLTGGAAVCLPVSASNITTGGISSPLHSKCLPLPSAAPTDLLVEITAANTHSGDRTHLQLSKRGRRERCL